MGIEIAQVKTISELLPKRGPAVYSAGIKDGEKGTAKYGPKSSDNPVLIIVRPFYDGEGNYILPGYYELMLSIDRTMLLMSQAGKIIATMPVFKLEEDRSQLETTVAMDKKSQKKYNKEKKKEYKKMKKLYEDGKIPSMEPEIYSKASIEYDEQGRYYLVKYEKGAIKAWGAIK